MITIKNTIPTSGIPAQTAFSFSIAGFITPPSTKTSSSFILRSLDSNSYLIDEVSQYLTVTMLYGLDISDLSITPDSTVVGSSGAHTLKFTSPISFQSQNTIQVIIPNEVTPPSSGLICQGVVPLKTTLYCTISGRIVNIVV